jgi:AAA family ATP:ADP antiporter
MTLRRTDSTVHAAAIGAAALIANQVAGKATRDAFFLSHFAVTALPVMVMVASLLSIAAGLLTARLMTVVAPSRFLPRAFGLSSALLVMEWWISSWSPGTAAILIYLRIAILGSTLISGFWSLLDDRFDARSAKRQFGRIVAASTFGGVIGGVLAERVGSTLGVANMLPILAALHLVCSFISATLAPPRHTPPKQAVDSRQSISSLTVLRTVPYVRNLALLILLSTVGAGLLDYVFKLRVSAAYQESHELVRFFSLFYAGTGVVTFLVQLVLSRVAVERLGIAGTVSSLPLTLAFGSIGGLLSGGVPIAFAMRGGEAVARSSLFKSGYEMLYAAVPRRERRATKAILDVGVERLGDLLAALLLGALLLAMPSDSTVAILVLAACLGLTGFWISRKLRRGYIQALEKSLLSQTLSGQISRTRVSSAVSIMQTLRSFTFGENLAPSPEIIPVLEYREETPIVRDPILQRIEELRSRDVDVVRRLLAQPLEAVLTSHVIAILAWDEVSTDAIDALKKIGSGIAGQLVDALLDPAQEFAIRRRIPRVLAEFDSQRAVDGLVLALSDKRFEVRFHTGQALTEIQNRNPKVVIDRESIMTAVEHELEVNPEVRRHHRVIDVTREEQEGAITIKHVFRLLALVLPREPLQIAHRALMSRDEHLKGTSLEYLENVLPLRVSQRILPLFEETTASIASAAAATKGQ